MSSLKVDLHIHTRYSDGYATITEVLEQAEQTRLDFIAITDHALSYKGISPRQFRAQRAEVEALRSSFRVKVLVGLEVEMKVSGMEELEKYDDPDILLLSSHTLVPPQTYLQMVETSLQNYPFRVLAHHRWHPLYPVEQCTEERLLDVMKENGMVVEINNRHHLPNDWFLRYCAEKGLQFTIGSDAHQFHEVGRAAWSESMARRLFNPQKIYIPQLPEQ